MEWYGHGLQNVPMIFRRIMNSILGEYIGKVIEVYIDDVIIYVTNP